MARCTVGCFALVAFGCLMGALDGPGGGPNFLVCKTLGTGMDARIDGGAGTPRRPANGLAFADLSWAGLCGTDGFGFAGFICAALPASSLL